MSGKQWRAAPAAAGDSRGQALTRSRKRVELNKRFAPFDL